MATTTSDLGGSTSAIRRREEAPAASSGGEAIETPLVRRAQAGDLEAFEQLMGLHVRRIRTFVALRAPATHLIDEVTHEAFVFAYHHLHEFTAGSALAAWLRAIAGNILRAEIQRFSREQANRTRLAEHLMIERDRHQAQAAVGDSPWIEALERCLEDLPDEMRDLLTLRYHDNLSAKEIAETTGRTVAWVRTTLFRLRQRLKDGIVQRLAGEDRP